MNNSLHKQKVMLLYMGSSDTGYNFDAGISEAMAIAELEVQKLNESIYSIESLKPDCDKVDYALAAGIGAISGVIDIFLVGKPGQSPIGDLTDEWFGDRVKGFAGLCGWKGSGMSDDPLASAIRFLEEKFKIPYDQTSWGEAAKEVFNLGSDSLTPSNHHFKSLGHNPTLAGLFFSIMDQFANSSHFVTGGKNISLNYADGEFELRGNSIPAKFVCAFINWFGHLISDVSGSSGSKGRGMGIPSPIWSWTNDIVAIKRSLNLPESSLERSLNEIALNTFEKGFDFRFQTAQLIPVMVNEILVRTIYSFRRLISFMVNTRMTEFQVADVWKYCEPFSNASVKRMLSVAHGTFCLVDAGDAIVHGFSEEPGTFNALECVLRLNVAGIGRFGISLYGEAQRSISYHKAQNDVLNAKREKKIVEDYIEGLKILSVEYDDRELLSFVDDLQGSGLYKTAFKKTVRLAEKRHVPEGQYFKTKADIDNYFRRR